MLVYSAKIVQKLEFAKGNAMPKPFPGKWPTRLMIQGDAGRIIYLGKPIIPIRPYTFQFNEQIYLTEFDKAQRFLYLPVPLSTAFDWNQRLFNLYHPLANINWADVLLFMQHWFGWPQKVHMRKSHRFYVPRYEPVSPAFLEQTMAGLLSEPAPQEKPKAKRYPYASYKLRF